MGPIKSAILLGVVLVLITYLYNFYTALPPVMGGASSFEFRPVVQTYKKFIQSGSDMGSSFAVIYGDKLVVNVFGGYTDTRFRLPWTVETVTQAFTLSLISVPLTFGVLSERYVVATVYLYLQQVTDQLFGPTNKIPAVLPYIKRYDFRFVDPSNPVSLVSWHDNPKAVLVNITHQVPPTKPKVQIMHLHSLALLADGIVRQVDPRQRTLGHFFMEEIAWPLG
ncbi:Beta-lactamase [Paragonimus heterotremus]|uniref:Beta-lactamase n=1 Tax=Paragonimus heterotremus TaxID=100268 RepID=A0A8J4T5U1_9TREM|nr:Beta-lactamase [Paragonimus heterotremus]